MRQSIPAASPGMRTFLNKLAKVEGHVYVNNGIVTFPNGTTANLSHLIASGVVDCWHCGALMNEHQRYICGCPKCMTSYVKDM